MARDTAFSSRNLWQIPTFLLGIAALAAVWYGRPYWQQTPAQRYENDLNALRQALDKSPIDTSQIITLLRAVHGVEPPKNLEKQVPYIIGSAMVVAAESAPSPEDAVEQWKTARQLLEAAAQNGIEDLDRQRHQYRLAKTWAHTGEPAFKVIDSLNATLKCGDDPSDGQRVLAEMYLKIEPPDSRKARDALKEYMAKMLPARTEAQQRQLNQARLLLGELQIQLGEPDDARKVLERIGPDSPAEMLIAARTLLAQSYLDEEEWTQAIRCLEQARDVRGITPAQKTFVLYHLADAYLRSKRKTEASAALEQLRKGSGPEAQAAACRLVELQINEPTKRESAVQVLEAIAADFPPPDQYKNKLLPLTEARDVFEEAAQKLRAANAFDLSIRVARAYTKIAPNGRDHELAAEAMQAWGQLLLDQVALADATDRPRLTEEGTTHVREAAKEWHEVAALKKNPTERGDPLYRAADLFSKAGDQDEALKMLDELGLKVPDFPRERQADVWLKKGEVYVALGNYEQARLCFQNGIQIAEQHPSVALMRCRVRLAEILLRNNEAKALARVIADLEGNLANPELPKDKDQHESVLIFIADAFYQQKEYRKAEIRCRSLLDNFPDSPRALTARFMLGQCYWNIAGQEAEKCKTAKKIVDDPATADDRRGEAETQFATSYKLYMDWLKKAAEPFAQVEAGLLKGSTNPKLPPADAELLRKASFYAADCAFFSAQYTECVARFDAIAQRYAGTVAQLEALKTMWRCYQYYSQNADKALDTLTQLRTAYLQMPESEFDGTSEIRRREYWQRWFDQVTPMKK